MTIEAAERHPFSLEAGTRELAWLAARNAFFGIVTLTLYRFWARTRMRRRLWARTRVMGDALEYCGSGWELFRGFLISLPTFFLPAIFAIYLAPIAFEPSVAAMLLIGFYLFAFPLANAARYWMRRYQLSRTRWRGIRLALEGSGWAYAWSSIGWSLLEFVTLGWYGPAARMRRAKMLWENTRFGDQPFSFGEGEPALARGLYGPYALAWFGAPLSLIGASIVIGAVMVSLQGHGFGGPNVPPPAWLPIAVSLGALIVAAFIFLLTWMPFTAAAMNRTADLIELDGARFRLHVTTFGLYGVTLLCALIWIFSIGFLAPLAGAIYVRYVFNRLEMIGAPRFAEIGQSIVAPPGSGEGIADAFDLDFGVGIV